MGAPAGAGASRAEPAEPAEPASPASGEAASPAAALGTPESRDLTMVYTALGVLEQRGGKEALRLLDQYARENDSPRLAIELQIIRVNALLRDGQRELARRVAEELVTRSPIVRYRPEIRALLESKP